MECPCCGKRFDPDNAEIVGKPDWFVSFGGRAEIKSDVICPHCESVLTLWAEGDITWDSYDGEPDWEIVQNNAKIEEEDNPIPIEMPKPRVKDCKYCQFSHESYDPRGCGPSYSCGREFCAQTGERVNYPDWDPHGLCKNSY